MAERMSEERLEILESRAHAVGDAVVIELCREIRRLQVAVARLADALREKPTERPTF